MPRAPDHFCITIEGNLHRIRERTTIDDRRDLGFVLAGLLDGIEVNDALWRAYGLRVTIEENFDQGADA